MNNGAELRSKWTKIREVYHENVHPNLVLVLLLVHTEVVCWKGLRCCYFCNYMQSREITKFLVELRYHCVIYLTCSLEWLYSTVHGSSGRTRGCCENTTKQRSQSAVYD